MLKNKEKCYTMKTDQKYQKAGKILKIEGNSKFKNSSYRKTRKTIKKDIGHLSKVK